MASSDICPDCKKRPVRSFCFDCTRSFCDPCWQRVEIHEDKAEGHAKQSIEERRATIENQKRQKAKWDAIFDAQLTSAERKRRHEQDLFATWVSIDDGEKQQLYMQPTERFGELANEHRRAFNMQQPFFPRLVAFIGSTGGGKSSLIRALIERPWMSESETTENDHSTTVDVPVVGQPANSVTPTSGDIHLYRCPMREERNRNRPLFFADCEGFSKAETSPPGSLAAHVLDEIELGQNQTARVRRIVNRSRHELKQMTSGSTRRKAVKHLFPRLLYTFSETVVYVTTKAGANDMEDIIAELLDWASRSRPASINHPTLPNAVIVINDCSKGSFWSVEQATQQVYSHHENILTSNSIIRKIREQFEGIAEVENLKALIYRFYQDLQVVRIPHADDYSRLGQQISCLAELIDHNTYLCQTNKRSQNLLLSSDEQQAFFDLAFKHFANQFDKPFDYIREQQSLQPLTNAGEKLYHFLTYLVKAIEVPRPSTHSSSSRSKSYSDSCLQLMMPCISSALALNYSRNSDLMRGSLLDHCRRSENYRYWALVSKAIGSLCEFQIPCDFSNELGVCISTRHGHRSGHERRESGSGYTIADGKYGDGISRKILAKWNDKFIESIREMHNRLEATMQRSGSPDQRIVFIEHIRRVRELHTSLQDFDITNFSACPFCIIGSPEKLLKCGHRICRPCAQAQGREEDQFDERLIHVGKCDLHRDEMSFEQYLQWKPREAGIRILCLDGGGVRGVIEVLILQAIERKLGESLPLSRFFDLIAGTSTGALIALGIGLNDWTLATCLQKYKALCKKAFESRVPRESDATTFEVWVHRAGNAVLSLVKGSWFKTTNVERHCKREFGIARFRDAEPQLPNPNGRKHVPQILLTATLADGKTPTIFTNYAREDDSIEQAQTNVQEKAWYRIENAPNRDQEYLVWECARATCAAPTYFRPFEKNHVRLWDGGLYNNNPSWIARHEAKIIWPDTTQIEPDLLLSIGGGNPKQSFSGAAGASSGATGLEMMVAQIEKRFLFASAVKSLYNRFEENMNSESLWREHFLSLIARYGGHRFIRLSPFLQPAPKLSDTRVLDNGDLEKKAEEFVEDHKEEIHLVVRRLIATSFFVQPLEERREVEHCATEQKINIRCRFLNRSDEIKALGTWVRENIKSPQFRLRETSHVLASIREPQLAGMERNAVFSLPAMLNLPANTSKVTIELVGEDFPPSAISGYPCRMPDTNTLNINDDFTQLNV